MNFLPVPEHGCVRFATATVKTLNTESGQDTHYSLHSTFHGNHIDILGLRETRVRCNPHSSSEHYAVRGSSADARANTGCQVLVGEGKGIVAHIPVCDRVMACVLSRDDVKFGVITAHAPTNEQHSSVSNSAAAGAKYRVEKSTFYNSVSKTDVMY